MRRLSITVIAAACTVLFTQSASAADMAVKAPVYKAPPAVLSWTGFYVGAELGGEWAHTTWTTTSLIDGDALPIDASSPRNYDPSGLRVGGYLGYNWQFAPQWVASIEVDAAHADKTVTAAGFPGCSIHCSNGLPGPGVDTTSVKMGWDASARARLGYLVLPSLLVYGTGGIAWQNFQTSATCQHSGPDPICFSMLGNPFVTATNDATRAGWTIGGGLEARVWGNWLLRGEYRYSDFGTWSNQFNLTLPGGRLDIESSQLKITTQTATLGIAYKFGP
jgi:outer membrane immunogenic protein